MEFSMTRFTAFAAILCGAAFTASPATAAESPQYRAELAAPANADRLVVRDIVWRCGGDTCVAPAGNSRPAVTCAALARQAGALRSFTVEGRAIPADALEKCNARAR
jgi:hypothetical protein